MASPRSYHSAVSAASSSANLAPPSPTPIRNPQRRSTTPNLPPPSAIDIPEPVYGNNVRDGHHRRSPSPLRQSFTFDARGRPVTTSSQSQSEDGSGSADDDVGWGGRDRDRAPSPQPSITRMAAHFVGSLMSGRSSANTMPSDAELEAEAERARAASRREAERILTQEAAERRQMEDRLLAMLNSSPASVSPSSQQARQRAQTLPLPPPETPSPSSKDKDKDRGDGTPGWWTAAKNRLTPTKEPLTPAQQVVQDAKERERREKKEARRAEKEARKRSAEWPATPESRQADPTLAALAFTTPPRRPNPDAVHASPGSSSSSVGGGGGAPHKATSLPPSLAPSPLASKQRQGQGTGSAPGSPAREPPPLYAQFSAQGVLDVPGTLLTIARRFEKLEKWAVGHVRALEERMGDVERWLVDKEHERASQLPANANASGSHGATAGHDAAAGVGEGAGGVNEAIDALREEMVELQGRIGELGREMAKLATAPVNLSNGPSRAPAPLATAPPTASNIVVHAQQQPPSGPNKTSPASSAMHSRQPSMHSHQTSTHSPQPRQTQTQPQPQSQAPATPRRAPSQTHSRRESMSPPFVPAGLEKKEPRGSRLPYPTGDYASPPASALALSPPASPPPSANKRPLSVAGLPSLSSASSMSSLTSGLGSSPSAGASASSSASGFGSSTSGFGTSTSGLGASPSPTPRKRYTVALDAPIMKRADSPGSTSGSDAEQEETIGRAAGRNGFGTNRNGYTSTDKSGWNDSAPSGYTSDAPAGSPSHTRERSGRARPVSVAMAPGASGTTPLRIRMRSQSAASVPTDDEQVLPPLTPGGTGKFIDPLVLRREQRENGRSAAAMPGAGRRKLPVKDLAAFFETNKT